MEQYSAIDYHNMHKKPVRKYRVLQTTDNLTNRKRWAVVWFGGNGEMYKRFPTAYGLRAAVRLANRLNKEWKKMGGNNGDTA